MSITVYTYNDKVLKNTATDKWLKKKEAPAGFVMDASNAEYLFNGGQYWVSWHSPAYPSAYNGNGKQYTLVNNNTPSTTSPILTMGLTYTLESPLGGPRAIESANLLTLGTSTGTLMNNSSVGDEYGVTLSFSCGGATLEQVQTFVSNLTITILDP